MSSIFSNFVAQLKQAYDETWKEISKEDKYEKDLKCCQDAVKTILSRI